MNLLDVIANHPVTGASFVSLDTLTNVTLTGGKKNPMQGRVSKIVNGSSVMIFSNKKSNAYENMVQRRLEQEGKDPESFVLSPRKWGERVPETPIITHKDKFYMEVIFLKAGEVIYMLDGVEVSKGQIEGLPVDDTEPKDNVQAGLERQVVIRTYAVDSIKAISIDNNRFEF